MDIEVRDLKMVQAVSEEGGLTKAAERLFVTQSALSHQLIGLEKQLGTLLFQRLRKKMVLTQAGERLLNSSHLIQRELSQAQMDILRLARGDSGELRISTSCYTTYHWLPTLLSTYEKQFPNIQVKIVVEATRHPVEAIYKGTLDLGVTITPPLPNSRLRSELLFEDELAVIMPPKHRLARNAFISAHDLAQEHLILYALPDEKLPVITEVLKPAGLAPKRVSKVELTEAIVELVKAGLGLGVMATWAVLPQLRNRELVARPLTRKGCRRQWYAVMANGSDPPPYVLGFIDLLKKKSLPVLRMVRVLASHNSRRKGRQKLA